MEFEFIIELHNNSFVVLFEYKLELGSDFFIIFRNNEEVIIKGNNNNILLLLNTNNIPDEFKKQIKNEQKLKRNQYVAIIQEINTQEHKYGHTTRIQPIDKQSIDIIINLLENTDVIKEKITKR